jgi:hypothetical protein
MQLFRAVRDDLRAGHVEHVGGLRATAPARTWGWTELVALGVPGADAMRDALDGLTARSDGRRDIAGARACAELTELILWPLVTGLTLHSRGWSYRSAGTAVHAEAAGWDAVAVPRPHVALARGDVLAWGSVGDGETRTVLDGHDDVVRWTADEAAPVLAALVEAIRAEAPFGRRGLWAIVATEVVFAALVAAHRSRGDDRAALRTARAFLDRVGERTGAVIPRPPTCEVATASGERLAPTKATCCLRYEVTAYAVRPDPLCLTCPRRPESERPIVYAAWLDRLAAATPAPAPDDAS